MRSVFSDIFMYKLNLHMNRPNIFDVKESNEFECITEGSPEEF